jgi:uncharacterized protein YndB with AHSA1/START domain
MSGTYERTFTVSVPAARAFQAFIDPADLEVWLRNASRPATTPPRR